MNATRPLAGRVVAGVEAPGGQQVRDASDTDARAAPQPLASVSLAAQAYLPVLFAVLLVVVWALPPGPFELGQWMWTGPVSVAAAGAGAAIPKRERAAAARWLARLRNVLGLVLLANVLLSIVLVMLMAMTLQLPLG